MIEPTSQQKSQPQGLSKTSQTQEPNQQESQTQKLASALQTRAQKSLLNPAEASLDICTKASADALEFAKDRLAPTHAVEDFAFYRLKLYLKIAIDAEDEMFYKQAIKSIEGSPLIKDGEIKGARFYISKVREAVI